MSRAVNIFGREIQLKDSFANTYIISKKYKRYSQEVYNALMKAYDKKESFELILTSDGYAERIYQDSIKLIVEEIVKEINRKGRYDIDTELYYKKYICPNISSSDFLDEIDAVKDEIEQICRQRDYEITNREISKNMRRRWVGGGIGVAGAIKGVITADVMNGIGGVAYGIKNGIGNTISAYKADENIKDIINKAFQGDLFQRMKHDILDLRYAEMNYYRDCGYLIECPELEQQMRAYNIYEALKKQRMDTLTRQKNVLEMIELNPINSEFYEWLGRYNFLNEKGIVELVCFYDEQWLCNYFENKCKDYATEVNHEDFASIEMCVMQIMKEAEFLGMDIEWVEKLPIYKSVLKYRDKNYQTIDEIKNANIEYKKCMIIIQKVGLETEEKRQKVVQLILNQKFHHITVNYFSALLVRAKDMELIDNIVKNTDINNLEEVKKSMEALDRLSCATCEDKLEEKKKYLRDIKEALERRSYDNIEYSQLSLVELNKMKEDVIQKNNTSVTVSYALILKQIDEEIEKRWDKIKTILEKIPDNNLKYLYAKCDWLNNNGKYFTLEKIEKFLSDIKEKISDIEKYEKAMLLETVADNLFYYQLQSAILPSKLKKELYEEKYRRIYKTKIQGIEEYNKYGGGSVVKELFSVVFACVILEAIVCGVSILLPFIFWIGTGFAGLCFLSGIMSTVQGKRANKIIKEYKKMGFDFETKLESSNMPQFIDMDYQKELHQIEIACNNIENMKAIDTKHEQEKMMFCTWCGKQIERTNKFCIHCGNIVTYNVGS